MYKIIAEILILPSLASNVYLAYKLYAGYAKAEALKLAAKL